MQLASVWFLLPPAMLAFCLMDPSLHLPTVPHAAPAAEVMAHTQRVQPVPGAIQTHSMNDQHHGMHTRLRPRPIGPGLARPQITSTSLNPGGVGERGGVKTLRHLFACVESNPSSSRPPEVCSTTMVNNTLPHMTTVQCSVISGTLGSVSEVFGCVGAVCSDSSAAVCLRGVLVTEGIAAVCLSVC